jgi:hypothetical protein
MAEQYIVESFVSAEIHTSTEHKVHTIRDEVKIWQALL